VRTIHTNDGDDLHVMDDFIIPHFGRLRDGWERCVENVSGDCPRAKKPPAIGRRLNV
jgi:hypothetical protein